jgi:arylsulfatase A-like enzyme
LIVIDTLRHDYIGANGNPWIHTPALDAFARQGTTFERCYANSFPTIPCRWELITGRAHAAGLPFHPWRPLEWGVPTVPDALRAAGYVTMLLCDTPHLINHGYGFDRPFHAWDLIRGQEVDRSSTEPLTPADLPPAALRHWRPWTRPGQAAPADALDEAVRGLPFPYRQYFRNRRRRGQRDELDYLPARLFAAGARWLERNRGHERFFLWIDCFDPHEPWDPPPADRRRYEAAAGGVAPVVPTRGRPIPLTADAAQTAALYAGEVTLVDRWLGHFLRTLDGLGLADRTVVIVMSDHGTLTGELGRFGKGFPLHEPIAHQALCLRLPGGAGAARRVPDLVQPVDVARTVLDLAGVTPPAGMPLDGTSLLPRLRSDAGPGPALRAREVTLSGGVPPFGGVRASGADLARPISVRDRRWTLLADPDRDRWRLLDGEADAGLEDDRLADHPAAAAQLHEALVATLRAREVDPAWLRAYAEARPGGPPPAVLEGLEAEAARRPRFEQFQDPNYL